MSLSRAENKRSLPMLSPGRWLLAGFLLIAALLISFVLLIRSADADYRGDEQRAVAEARSAGGLAEVDDAVLYTWETPIWVVRGRDADGRAWMIWERAEGIVKLPIDEGYDEQAIRRRFTEAHGGVDIVRVLPGWFRERPVWEIRYANPARGGLQSIDFYAFEDGNLLQTYDLPGG